MTQPESQATAAARLEQLIDKSPIGSVQLIVFFLCFSVAFFDGFDIQAIGFAAPAIISEWGIQQSDFTTVFTAGLLGVLIGVVGQGPVSDTVGRRPIIIASLLIFGALSLATVFVSNLSILILLRFVTGVGLGAAIPNIIALTAEYAPKRRRALAIALMMTGFPLGGFLGGLFASVVLDLYSWHALFLIGGIAPFLVAAVAYMLLPESILFMGHLAGVAEAAGSPRAEEYRKKAKQLLARIGISEELDMKSAPDKGAQASSRWKDLFADGRGLSTSLLWFVTFINQVVWYFLISWLPTTLASAGLSAERAVIPAAMLNLGAIVGGVVLSWFSDRTSVKFVLGVNFIFSAVLCIAVGGAISFGLPALIVAAILTGLSVGGAQLVLNALAAEFYPTGMRSTGVGGASLAGRMGSVAGPLLGGAIIAAGGSTFVLFGSLAVLPVLAAGGVSALRIRSSHQ